MDGPLSTQFISRTTVDGLPAGDIKSINKAAKTVDMNVQIQQFLKKLINKYGSYRRAAHYLELYF